MSFPTTNLYARYEPWRWGYSDGDVINTSTKKFTDDSGNARHLNSAVTGSPTYKTSGLNGLQYVRFSGSSQAVHGSAFGDSDDGTVVMVVVPQATPGGSQALFSFNDNGSHNGPQVYYDGAHYVGYSNGSGTSSNAITPIIGKPDILWFDYKASSGMVMRTNMWPSGSRGSYTAYTPTQFSLAFNGFSGYYQLDCYALFRYSARLVGSDQTDLETYLYQTYIPTILSGLPSSHLIGLYRPDSESYSDGVSLGGASPIHDQSAAAINLDSVTQTGQTYKTNIYSGRAVYREAGGATDRGLSSTGGGHAISSRQHTIASILIPRGSIGSGRRSCLDHTTGSSGVGAAVTLHGTGPVWELYEYDGSQHVATGGTPTVGTADQITALGADNSTCILRVNRSQVGTVAVGVLQTSTTQFTIGGNGDASSSNTAAQADTVVALLYDTPIGGQWLTDVESWVNNNYVSNAYTDSVPAGSYLLTGYVPSESSGERMPTGSYIITGRTFNEVAARNAVRTLNRWGFAAKLESTYGTIAAPATSDAVLLAAYPTVGAASWLRRGDRGKARGIGPRTPTTRGGLAGTLTVDAEGIGASSAFSSSVKPHLHSMYLLAGLDATLDATGGAETYTYTITSALRAGTAPSSATVDAYVAESGAGYGFVRHRLYGAFASLGIAAGGLGVPQWHFDVMGLLDEPVDVDLPSFTYPTLQPAPARNIGFTLSTFTAGTVRAFDFQTNREHSAVRGAVRYGKGHPGFRPGAFDPTLQVTFEAPRLAAAPPWSDTNILEPWALAGEADRFAININVGTTQYNRWKLTAANAYVKDVAENGDGPTAVWTLTLGFAPSTLNALDHFRIIWY